MSFLNPAILLGVLLVGVPIAIHLLNKNRVREVRWPMMKFLLNIVRKNEKRLQMEDLILLICRCIIVGLLALAFARPAIWLGQGTFFLPDPVTAVVLLDVSGSMGYGNGVETRLDQAKKAANDLLATFTSGSESTCALYLVSDQVLPVVPHPTADIPVIRKAIQNAQVTERGSDLYPAIQQAASLLSTFPEGHRGIFIITDNQAEAWKQSRRIQKFIEENSTQIAIKFISVADKSDPNLAVTQMELDGGVAAVRSPIICRVTVSNWSDQAATNVRVSLSSDGEAPLNESVIPTIAPNSSQMVNMGVKFNEPGYHSLTAAIPADRLPYDNQRALGLQVMDESRVLMVEGSPAADPNEREGFFLENALQPVPRDKKAEYYLKVVHKGANSIPLDNLSQFDSIILADVPQMNAATTTALNKYVLGGGSLIVFTGPNTEKNLNFWQKDPQLVPLLPARLLGAVDVPEDKKFITLQTKDYGHPVVFIWNEPQNGQLGGVKFTKYFNMEAVEVPATPVSAKDAGKTPAAQMSGVRSILDFSTGKPAVIEGSYGDGRVVLFASTATTAWNSFPIHPGFVPFIQRLLGHLSRRAGETLIVAPGQPFIHSVPPDLIGQDFFVLRPEPKAKPKLAGRIEGGVHGGTVRYPDTAVAGAYALFIGEKKKPFIVFAVQPDSRESNLAIVDSKDLDPILAAAKAASEKQSTVSGIKGKKFSGPTNELWGEFILIAFLLTLAELVMAHRFSMPK